MRLAMAWTRQYTKERCADEDGLAQVAIPIRNVAASPAAGSPDTVAISESSESAKMLSLVFDVGLRLAPHRHRSSTLTR
jgi:hypothetical protein